MGSVGSVDRLGEDQLRHFNMLRSFQSALVKQLKSTQVDTTWEDTRRKLALGDYLSLYLFAMLNPAIDSLRGACAASHLERVGREVCSGPVSLGSFSEAQHLVDESLLQSLFERLQSQLPRRRDGDWPERLAQLQVRLIDSSVWRVCQRLGWAYWRPSSRGQGTGADYAVRLHTVFDLGKGMVEKAELTRAKLCERKAWKKLAQPGQLYVGDRYYSYDHSLLKSMADKQVHFLVRTRIDTQWVLEEELPLDVSAREAGITYAACVRLGAQGKGVRVRVVQIMGEDEAILLLSSVPESTLSLCELAALYKERWQIECFFHWFKCIFKNRHWFCHSQRGMQVQIYLALIAAVLLMLFTGKRPNKRCMETIQLYMDGWCRAEELPALLKKYL